MSGQQDAPPPAPSEEAVRAALQSEQAIKDKADAIWEEQTSAIITNAILDKLYPLLAEPIPAAYILTTGATRGKPYVSTGIRSVQVQIDRMNNVLRPRCWWEEVTYEQDGKLCRVTIKVGTPGSPATGEPPEVLLERSSMGGVNQGSTLGNIYKGSYTNAAKRAFAALGVGHEVYVGAADLDPDVNPEVPTTGPAEEPVLIGKDIAKKMVDRVWLVPGLRTKLQLAASHVAERDVGACDTKAHATDALARLTYPQAERVSTWIDQKEAAEREAAPPGQPPPQPEGEGQAKLEAVPDPPEDAS